MERTRGQCVTLRPQSGRAEKVLHTAHLDAAPEWLETTVSGTNLLRAIRLRVQAGRQVDSAAELALWRIHQGDRWGSPQFALLTSKDLNAAREVHRAARSWARSQPGWTVRETNGRSRSSAPRTSRGGRYAGSARCRLLGEPGNGRRVLGGRPDHCRRRHRADDGRVRLTATRAHQHRTPPADTDVSAPAGACPRRVVDAGRDAARRVVGTLDRRTRRPRGVAGRVALVDGAAERLLAARLVAAEAGCWSAPRWPATPTPRRRSSSRWRPAPRRTLGPRCRCCGNSSRSAGLVTTAARPRRAGRPDARLRDLRRSHLVDPLGPDRPRPCGLLGGRRGRTGTRARPRVLRLERRHLLGRGTDAPSATKINTV